MITRENALEFVQRGRVIVPLQTSHLIAGVIRGFERLTAESNEYRQLWKFDLSRNNDPDDGLILRNGELAPDGVNYDHKFFLHFKQWLPELLRQRNVDLKRYRAWLRDCQSLLNVCVDAGLDFAEQFDSVMPGINLWQRMMDPSARCQNVLRLLWYVQHRPDSDLIGQGHFDRDLVTFHIAENKRGLWTGNQKELFRTQPDTALLFPGLKMQVLSENKVLPLDHGIRDVQENTSDGRTVRWSIVSFLHADVDISHLRTHPVF